MFLPKAAADNGFRRSNKSLSVQTESNVFRVRDRRFILYATMYPLFRPEKETVRNPRGSGILPAGRKMSADTGGGYPVTGRHDRVSFHKSVGLYFSLIITFPAAVSAWGAFCQL